MPGPIDSLRMSAKDCEQILRSLEAATKAPVSEQRGEESKRHAVDGGLIAVLKLMPREGRVSEFRVRPRNLSSGGLGFLHGQFIYPDTPCQIILINDNKQGFGIAGKVVRCRLIEKHVHEVGVRFDNQIDISIVLGARLEVNPSGDAQNADDQAA